MSNLLADFTAACGEQILSVEPVQRDGREMLQVIGASGARMWIKADAVQGMDGAKQAAGEYFRARRKQDAGK
jgi:hypothetical protein